MTSSRFDPVQPWFDLKNLEPLLFTFQWTVRVWKLCIPLRSLFHQLLAFHFSKPNHASTDQNLRILFIISLLAYWWNPYLDAWTILATPHWIFGPNNFQHVWHFISIKWVMIQHSTTFLQQIFGGKY